MDCRCETCRGGSTYYCIKRRAGLLDGYPNGSDLTVAERYLVGMLPPAPVPDPRAVSAVGMLAAIERLDEAFQARLRGLRWLVDIDGERCELEA